MQYIIDAHELYSKAKEIINAGMDYVEITLMEPDDYDPDDPIPVSVHFDAWNKRTPFEHVDFEDIDVIDDEV